MAEPCWHFFSRIFHDFDKDRDQLLNKAEQLEMFSTAPQEYALPLSCFDSMAESICKIN